MGLRESVVSGIEIIIRAGLVGYGNTQRSRFLKTYRRECSYTDAHPQQGRL